ncbi:MAG TPA: GyrI-like domain-containing protein [Candidatus Paceibacterota bacterium]|nr:GyrI-like domain-containing protein [Candidatus Paceibacterota bacterium]
MQKAEPIFETMAAKKLIGKKLTMSFADYEIAGLWRDFMPRRREVANAINNDLISAAVYQADHFKGHNPAKMFDKWAGVEVSTYDHIPEGMEALTLPGGLYAVFEYRGLNTDDAIYRYIYGEWLSGSGYALDNRPHFEVLGEKYENNDPNSEEEIWVPIKPR